MNKIKLPNGQEVYGRQLNETEEGTIIQLDPAQVINTSIGDISLKDNIVFYKNGTFKTGELSAQHEIETPVGKKLAHRYISLYSNGNLESIQLSSPTEINTPIGALTFTKYGILKFYENGNIKEGYLKEKEYFDFGISRVPIRGSIEFYKSGKIKLITQDYKMNLKVNKTNYSLWKETPIEFYESGNVKSCIIEKSEYAELAIKDNTDSFIEIKKQIEFYENGDIKSCNFAHEYEKLIIAKQKVEFSGTMKFYKSRSIAEGTLKAERVLNTKNGKLAFYGEIFFYENGNIKEGRLARTQVINVNNEKMILRENIYFHENGNIKEGKIYNDQGLIKDHIVFDENGNILKEY